MKQSNPKTVKVLEVIINGRVFRGTREEIIKILREERENL